tara:strand:- start:346 stop:525 length:180 start_codon:yes stop_codon:yes gene_type:complete
MKNIKFKLLGSTKKRTLKLFGEPLTDMEEAIHLVRSVPSPRLELTQKTETGGERSWDNF